MFDLNLLYILFTLVFIIDYSGVIDKISSILFKSILGKTPQFPPMIPLISCSLCMTWWITLSYTLFNEYSFLESTTISASLAFLARPVSDLLRGINSLLIKIINKLL